MAWRRARDRAHAETPRPGVVRQHKVAADLAVQKFATRDIRLTLYGFSGYASKTRFPRRRPRIGCLKPRNCYILCLFTATPFTFTLTTELERPVSSEIRATSGFSAMAVGLLQMYPNRCPFGELCPRRVFAKPAFCPFWAAGESFWWNSRPPIPLPQRNPSRGDSLVNKRGRL